MEDLDELKKHYAKTSASPDWEDIKHLDLNNDGRIDMIDLMIMSQNLCKPPEPPRDYWLLEVEANPEGITDPPAGRHEVRKGGIIELYAYPNEGYYFDYWEINGVRDGRNPASHTMTKDTELKVFYTTTAPPPAKNWWEELRKVVDPVASIKATMGDFFPATRQILELTTPEKMKTPDNAWKIWKKLRDSADSTAEGLALATLGVEAVTIGQIDIGVERFTRLPGFAFVDEVGRQLRLAQVNAGFSQLYERYLNTQYQAKLMPAGAWAIARQKEWITDEKFFARMTEFGFDRESAMYQYWAAERPPPLETILELDRRGLIEEPWQTELYKSTLMQGWTIDWVKQLKVQFPEPYRLAEMASKGIMPEEEMIKYMSYFGLTGQHGKMWTEAQLMRPTLGMLNSMFWRKAIKEDEWQYHLRRTGFSTAAIEQLESLRYVIPPLPDLITMAVREAFGKHTYEEQMPALIEWGGKMGLTSDWVERYWYAHWDRIALREMYSNLWREHWTEDEFMRMLRIKDVHPDDREAILRVAYLPPSIRELGYGYDMNVYNRPDIVKYRKMGGLSPLDAELSADSLIRYRQAAELGAIRREWLWLYSRERISENEFRVALIDTGLRLEMVDLWVQRGDLQIIRFKKGTITEEGRLTTATEAVWAFKNKLRDEDWLRARLKDLDWTPDRIELAVEKAWLQRIEIPIVEPDVKYKGLTLSQLQQLYRRGILGLDALRARIVEMGYKPEVADLLVELTIPEPEAIPEAKRLTISNIRSFYDMRIIGKADIAFEIEKLGYTPEVAEGLALNMIVSIDFPDLRARYSKGWLNDEELITEIYDLGLSVERAIELAETIIKAEMPERTLAEKNLTKSEIVKGVKVGILEALEAVKLIERLGYDEYEAWYVLLVNKAIDEPEKMSYWNWRQIVEAWRRSQGLQWQEIPDDLVALDFQIVAIKKHIEKEKEAKAPADIIAGFVVKLGQFQTQLRHRIQALELD